MALPLVQCVPVHTPTPLAIDACRLIFALAAAYNMITAWDVMVDQIIITLFPQLRGKRIIQLFWRAVISTVFALYIMFAVIIDVDDVFGSTLEP